MGQHLGAVHPFPAEGIVGHPVVLVPTDLRGHKHVDPGFFQDLGQRPGIAEHVREPQVFHVFSKFLFQETAADQELAGQGFPTGQVAVRLHPHAAVCLPAALFHALFDLFIDFRKIFFDIFVNLRLGLEKDIFRKQFHHAQHRGKGAGRFLMGVLEPPEPRHVDVGVPHAVNVDPGLFSHAVNLFIEKLICLSDGFVKYFAPRVRPVNAVAGLIQRSPQVVFHRISVVQLADCVQDQGTQIIEVVCLFIQTGQIRPFDLVLLLPGHTAALQSGPEPEGQAEAFSAQFFREKYFHVVDVHSLVRLFVDIAHGLKAGVVACPGLAEVKDSDHPPSSPFLRDLNLFVHPEITVPSGPAVPHPDGIPAFKADRRHRVDHALLILANRKFF